MKLVQNLHHYIKADFLKLSKIHILTWQMELVTYKNVQIQDIKLTIVIL